MWPRMPPANSQAYDSSQAYPMEVRNGKVVGGYQQDKFVGPTPPTTDWDFTQGPFRRYVNAGGYLNVQLPSGLDHHRWQGIRYPYKGAGWIWGFATPRIPNQMRYTGAGYPPGTMSTSQIQAIWNATVGSTPQNPAGTGPPGQFMGGSNSIDIPGTG